MQIADLRLLFRLPVPELDPNVGCNLTAAAMMLNLISGFSVWFFRTQEAEKIERDEVTKGLQRGRRFRGFVKTYWPTIPPEPVPADLVADRLYELRNSLVHDLGISDTPKRTEERVVGLAKHALPLSEIVELERTTSHPLSFPVIEEQGSTFTVHLTGVYWALHRMLREALNQSAKEIEQAIAAILIPKIAEITD